MDQSCHRGSADIKECEEMLGDDSAAVHLSQHTENHQRVDRCAKTAAKCVFSFKKSSKPSGIRRIVRQEQTKHGDSDDLMRCFSHNGIAHQHGQCRRHRKVNARFDLLPAVHFLEAQILQPAVHRFFYRAGILLSLFAYNGDSGQQFTVGIDSGKFLIQTAHPAARVCDKGNQFLSR